MLAGFEGPKGGPEGPSKLDNMLSGYVTPRPKNDNEENIVSSIIRELR